MDSKDHQRSHSKQSLRLWLRMLGCCTRIENTIRDRLRREFDTTLPRFDIMAALYRNPKGLTMSELSRYLMVSNGNVTGVVTTLEAAEMITRKALPTDRRTQVVNLTPAGRRQFKKMAKTHERWIDELFADLNASEETEILTHLERLQHSLVQQKAATSPEKKNA